MTDTIEKIIGGSSYIDFNAEFYLLPPDLLNGKLCKGNCYNPLIEHEMKMFWNADYFGFLIDLVPVEERLALQILRIRLKKNERPDITSYLREGAKKFNEIHEEAQWEYHYIQKILTAAFKFSEWQEKLRTPEDFCKALSGGELRKFYPSEGQYLSDDEFRKMDESERRSALAEITNMVVGWTGMLRDIRDGIQGGDTGHVIVGLSAIYETLKRIETPFIDFLQFRRIFEGCRWLWRSMENTPPGGFQDIIYYPINRRENMPSRDWNSFVLSYERPKDRLTEFFGTRADVDTERIGAYGFKNPYAEILQGKINETTFSNALEFMIGDIRDRKISAAAKRAGEQKPEAGADAPNQVVDIETNERFVPQNSSGLKNTNKKIFESITPYCSLNQHCKVLGLQNHSIFANSVAWKNLKENSPSKKRGNWTLYGLNAVELFELYTNYCIRNEMISPGSPDKLLEMYKNSGQSLDLRTNKN